MARNWTSSGISPIAYPHQSSWVGSIDHATKYSLSLWYTLSAYVSGGDSMFISKADTFEGATAAGTFALFAHGTSASVGTLRHYALGWTTPGSFSVPGPAVSATTWHHYAVAYDGGATTNKPTIVLDGVTQTVSVVVNPVGTYTFPDASAPIYIGNDNGGNFAIPGGALCDVALWAGTVLSATEMQAIYKQGLRANQIRPDQLSFYVPLEGISNPEFDYIGRSGGLTNWNGNGASTFTHDPPKLVGRNYSMRNPYSGLRMPITFAQTLTGISSGGSSVVRSSKVTRTATTSAIDTVSKSSTKPISVLANIPNTGLIARTISSTVANRTTFNPSDKNASITLSNANLTATDAGSGSAYVATRATFPRTAGRFYFEVTLVTFAGSSQVGIGLGTVSAALSDYMGQETISIGYFPNVSGSGTVYTNGAVIATAGLGAQGDVIGVAVDLTNQRLWFRVNGGSFIKGGVTIDITSASPSDYFSYVGFSTHSVFPMVNLFAPGDQMLANFGASAFANPLPAGFSAWDTTNMGVLSSLVRKTNLVPTNPTIMNASDANANLTITGGLTITANSDVDLDQLVRATIARNSGKWYFEWTVVSPALVSDMPGVGFANANQVLNDFIGNTANSFGIYPSSTSVSHFEGVETGNGGGTGYHAFNAAPIISGDIVGIGIDFDRKKFYVFSGLGQNGVNVWNNGDGSNPSTNTLGVGIGTITGPWYPAADVYRTGASIVMNFGRTPFAYSVPTGYRAWNANVTFVNPTLTPVFHAGGVALTVITSAISTITRALASTKSTTISVLTSIVRKPTLTRSTTITAPTTVTRALAITRSVTVSVITSVIRASSLSRTTTSSIVASLIEAAAKNKALTTSASVIASVLRTLAAIRSTSASVVATISRKTSAARSATITVATSILRALTTTRTATTSIVATITKSATRPLTTTAPVLTSMVRKAARTLTTSPSVLTSIARSQAVTRAASISVVASLTQIKAKLQTLSASVPVVAAMLFVKPARLSAVTSVIVSLPRSLAHTLAISISGIASIARKSAVAKSATTSVVETLAAIKVKLQTVAASLSVLASFTRVSPARVTIVVTPLATIARSPSRLLTASTSIIASIRRAMTATRSASITVIETLAPLKEKTQSLPATVNVTTTLRRALAQTSTVTVSVITTISRVLARSTTTSITAITTIVRSPHVSKIAAATVLATFTAIKAKSQAVTTSITVVTSLVKSKTSRLTSSVGIAATLTKTFATRLTSSASVAASMTRGGLRFASLTATTTFAAVLSRTGGIARTVIVTPITTTQMGVATAVRAVVAVLRDLKTSFAAPAGTLLAQTFVVPSLTKNFGQRIVGLVRGLAALLRGTVYDPTRDFAIVNDNLSPSPTVIAESISQPTIINERLDV